MNAHSPISADTAPLAKLREPFAPRHVSKLPKESRRQIDERKSGRNVMYDCPQCGGIHHNKAVHLDYVGHAALTDRLLDTDLEWSWEPVAFGPDGLPALDRNGGLWIKLTVCGVTRLGYGDAEGKQGGNAVKEAIGDALRNAAMRFGAALDLWHKGDLHAEDDAPAETDKAEGGMPDAEWSKLSQLLQATKTPAKKLLDHYKVQNLRLLNQEQYADALSRLNDTLAKLAKAETDKAAGSPPASEFADIADDDLPY